MAASTGKRHYRQIKKIDANLYENLLELQHLLNEGKFVNSDYKSKVIIERGKEREIFSLPYWPDRVVQHAIVQVLAPIWMPTMIRGTYASIPRRGIHDAKKRLLHDLRSSQVPGKYCLKMDIRKFYPTINHKTLQLVIRKKIKDPQVLELLDQIILSVEVTAPETGIPIGNYLSQWFSNIYLSEMDWKIKQEYKIKGYHRYCDDVILLHDDKKYLHKIKDHLSVWLMSRYQLEIKDNWQIFPTEIRGVDFVGYRAWKEKTLIRKTIKVRMATKMSVSKGKKSHKLYLKAIKSLPSYNGWTLHGSTHKLRKKLLVPWLEMENYENTKH